MTVTKSGVQGPQGVQGVQGSQGFQGVQGAGSQGLQGAQGTQGFQGAGGTGGSSRPLDLNLNGDYGATAGTDISTAYNAALADIPQTGTTVGGLMRIGGGHYFTSKPLILPHQTILEGVDGRGTTTISPTTLFPTTTLSNGGSALSLPAATIPYADNSSMANANAHGTIHMMMSSGVRADVTYTGINRTTHQFTGCTTNQTGTVNDGEIIGFPVMSGGDTVTATGGVYGCCLQRLGIDGTPDGTVAGVIPGIVLYYSDRIEEQSGAMDCIFWNAYLGAIIVANRSTTGQHAQNWGFYRCTVSIAGARAPAGAFVIDADGNGTAVRGFHDFTIQSVGLVKRTTSAAVRLYQMAGSISKFNIENHQYGIKIDNSPSPCRAIDISQIDAGANVDTLVWLTASTGNVAATIRGLTRYSNTTNLIQDDTRGGRLISENTLAFYASGIPKIGTKRSYLTTSPSHASLLLGGLVPPTKLGSFLDSDFANPEDGMIGFNLQSGHLEGRSGGAWAALAPSTAGTIIGTASLTSVATDRSLPITLAGSVSAPMTDTADYPIAVPDLMTLRRMKVTAKTAPIGTMTVQLRRSTDAGATWADVAGFAATFSSGSHIATIDPTDVNVNENDLLGFSVPTGSGANLLVEVIAGVRDLPTWLGNIGFTNAQGSSGTVTTTTTVPAGGTIIVAIAAGGVSVDLSSISGGGLTWRIDASNPQSDGKNMHFARAYCPAGLAAGTVITATFSATSGKFGIAADLWAGLADAAAIATKANSGAGGTSTLTTGALTAVTQPALYLAGFAVNNQVTSSGWTPESGWTAQATNAYDATTGSFQTMLLEYLSTQASGTYTATVNIPSYSTDNTETLIALAAG